MKKAPKITLALLLLPLLLAACRITPASPTPGIPTMPPSTQDGGLPPREGEDPLDIWREQREFRDTKVVFPQRAVNFPVLIVDPLQLDWKVLERFVRANMPDDDISLSEDVSYFKDSLIPDREAYGERYMNYSLQSDVYDTEWGQETASISEDANTAYYRYRKWFMNMPLEDIDQTTLLPLPKASAEEDEPEDFGPMRYSEEEAVELVRSALHEWGVPVEELELQFVWAYDSSPNDSALLQQQRREILLDTMFWWHGTSVSEDNHRIDEDGLLKRFDLPYGGRGITLFFRHMLYDIPVFDSGYEEIRDPQSPQIDSLDPLDPNYTENFESILAKQRIGFMGDHAHAVVTDLGVRTLSISFHRVIEVEKHDVPIRPLRDIVEVYFDTIKAMGPIRRVELMLVPTYYSAEFEQTRYRLVPAWCFFDKEAYELVIIDAAEGRLIHPADEFWRRWAAE